MALEPVYADTPGSAEAALSLSPRQEEMIGLRLAAVDKIARHAAVARPGPRCRRRGSRISPHLRGRWMADARFPQRDRLRRPRRTTTYSCLGRARVCVRPAFLRVRTAQRRDGSGRTRGSPERSGDLAARGPGDSTEHGPRPEWDRAAVRNAQAGDAAGLRPLGSGCRSDHRTECLPEEDPPRAEFFRIADLSSMWVVADLFGDQAGFVQPGSTARVSIPNAPGRVFQAKVATTLPQAAAAGNALQVRLEVANRDLTLRPDMFADVEFSVRVPAVVTAPAEAWQTRFRPLGRSFS